jgi:Na+/phosphate symporter
MAPNNILLEEQRRAIGNVLFFAGFTFFGCCLFVQKFEILKQF